MPKKHCHSQDCKNAVKRNGRYCNTCTSRKYRAKYPIKYAYDTLKTNAKRRDKEFTISLEYFQNIIKNSDYLEKKGKHNNSLQIDRIRNELGYVEGNIRVISAKENREAYREFIKQKIENREEGDMYIHDLSEPLPF